MDDLEKYKFDHWLLTCSLVFGAAWDIRLVLCDVKYRSESRHDIFLSWTARIVDIGEDDRPYNGIHALRYAMYYGQKKSVEHLLQD